MPRLDLFNGDVVIGQTAREVVEHLAAKSPFTQGQPITKYMRDMLPGLRGADMTKNIPDEVAEDPEAFLQAYQTVGLGRYTPGPGPRASSKLKVSLSGFGEEAPSSAVSGRAFTSSIPTNPATWRRMASALEHLTADGRRYRLRNTTTGWVASVDFDNAETFIGRDGTASKGRIDQAQRVRSAHDAVALCILHERAYIAGTAV